MGAFTDALAVGGLVAGLDYLNARTPYRFTFIYQAEGPLARRILVYDREALYISGRDVVPVSQTFFEFLQGEPCFATEDGLADPRSKDHVGSRHFRGFCGVQLAYPDGGLYGWLAHASPGPVPVPEGEVELLQAVAGPLMKALT